MRNKIITSFGAGMLAIVLVLMVCSYAVAPTYDGKVKAQVEYAYLNDHQVIEVMLNTTVYTVQVKEELRGYMPEAEARANGPPQISCV